MADILTDGRVDLRRRPRLPHARGRDLRRAAARPGRQPRAVRGAGRHHLQGVQRASRFSHKGKHYTLPPEVPYRGYTLKELTLVPRPVRLPVECWQPIQSGIGARARLHGQARHPGRDRRRLGRGRRDAQGRARLAGGLCPRAASSSNSASGCASASSSTSPTAASRASREAAQVLRREHEDVRRAAPGAGADRRADRDHARSRSARRRPSCRASRTR